MNRGLFAFTGIYCSFILTACASDFTQTKYPQSWSSFEVKSTSKTTTIDGEFSSQGEVVSDRYFPPEAKYKNLGYVLFSKLPGLDDPVESDSQSVSFKTMKNGDIIITPHTYYCSMPQKVWISGKDFFIKDRWIIRKDTLFLYTGAETQSKALKINDDGDLIVEKTDYGFGFYILFVAGNYNAWFRFKRISSGDEFRPFCK
jgi:hypothetical protein